MFNQSIAKKKHTHKLYKMYNKILLAIFISLAQTTNAFHRQWQ